MRSGCVASEAGIEAAGIEDAIRVEGALQPLVDRAQRRRAAARTRRPTCRGRGTAWRGRRRRPPPRGPAPPAATVASQRWAPCHSISSSPARPSSGAVGGSDRRQRAASWCSIASLAATKNSSRVVAQALPERVGGGRRRSASPPSWRQRRLDRGRGAAQAQHQVAVPPGAGIERQRLAAPGVQRGQRLGRLHVEAQRRLGFRPSAAPSATPGR